MSIQYSGGTLINRTFTPVTRGDWVNNVTQALSDAGWTTISGTPGSSADVVLETPATTIGAKIRFRFFDPASGNCAQVFMRHSSGSPTSTAVFCLPGSVLWRVIANKFGFFAFKSGSGTAITTAARSAVMGGVLWTPTWVTLSAGDAVGWMNGIGTTDVEATLRNTFRTGLRIPTGNNGWWASMYIAALVEGSSATAGNGSIPCFQGGTNAQDSGYRWEDLTLLVYEPFVAWATGASLANEGRIKGQMYDAIVVSGAFTSEATITFDGHTWLAITEATANTAQTQTLFVAVT